MERKNRLGKSQRHVTKTTLLVVGEGPDDQAFIKHMSQTFRTESKHTRSTIMKESGGSPGNIITNTVRKYRDGDYDKRYIVLDSDVPVDSASQKRAKQAGYDIILWSPLCLEGALLDTLNETVQPYETSQQLKQRLQPKLCANHTDPQAYSVLFTKSVLEASHNTSIKKVRLILLNTKA